MKTGNVQHPCLVESREDRMLEPEDVSRMLGLKQLGWGSKRIARELGVTRNTVKRYLAAGGYVGYRTPSRPGKLSGVQDWLQSQFFQHRGNCDVVRQQLASELGITVSLRTFERARATMRFEPAALGAAYNRTKFIKERVRMMQAWADYLERL